VADDYDEYDDIDALETEEAQPRDPKTDEAKAALRAFFHANPSGVWYERQLVVMFEQARRPRAYFDGEGFFHWIIVRALDELIAERVIETRVVALSEPVTDAVLRAPQQPVAGSQMRFLWLPRNRYVARRAETIRRLVGEFSTGEFGRALGQQGEMLFDAALPTQGFLPRARNTRGWEGRQWITTDHNLDRIFERDGVAYGIEIKNTLIYIPSDELEVKLDMCDYLGLRPLFIVRMAPKNYIQQVRQRGGYTMIFEWQQYPFGAGALAATVRAELGLPVDCRARIEDGTIQRFLRWHLEQEPDVNLS
jgi:hypothetical protein